MQDMSVPLDSFKGHGLHDLVKIGSCTTVVVGGCLYGPVDVFQVLADKPSQKSQSSGQKDCGQEEQNQNYARPEILLDINGTCYNLSLAVSDAYTLTPPRLSRSHKRVRPVPKWLPPTMPEGIEDTSWAIVCIRKEKFNKKYDEAILRGRESSVYRKLLECLACRPISYRETVTLSQTHTSSKQASKVPVDFAHSFDDDGEHTWGYDEDEFAPVEWGSLAESELAGRSVIVSVPAQKRRRK